jgi:Zn-dependent M28 family amino/carboxypeptidase
VVSRRAQTVVGGAAAVALLSMGALAAPAYAGDRDDRDRRDRDRGRDRVSVERFAKDVEVDEVLDHLDELQEIAEDNDGNRAAGTPGYEESVEYVVEELEDAGYKPVVQTFEFPFYQEVSSTFAQVTPTATDYVLGTDYEVLDFSASADVQAPLVPVDLALEGERLSTSGCEPEDFLADGASIVTGAVALLQRGVCPFGQKVANAAAAGAVGAVVMNQGNVVPGDDRLGLFNFTLGAPGTVPAVSVSFDDGVALAGTPGIVLRIATETAFGTRTTSNVIAETRRGAKDTVVMAGAHLDGVLEGAGINDNGSGSAALLEVALELADKDVRYKNAVRFAWWGAEESGLLGSAHYVNSLSEAERATIAAYLNFDMVASPNYMFGIYDGDNSGEIKAPEGFIPPGSAEIEDLFQSFYDVRGEKYVDSEFSGRSDYEAFVLAGIPSGGLFTGAEVLKTEEEVALFGGLAGVAYDPCYHQACDDLEGDFRDAEQEALYEQLDDLYELEGNVNVHALEVNTAVIASAILSLARDASAVTGAGTP